MWGVCGVCGVCRVCRVCGVRGDGGMSCVWAEGQWRGVDVVVVHHWAGQHQLEQTAGTDTHKKEILKGNKKKGKEKEKCFAIKV